MEKVFSIEKKGNIGLERAGIIHTKHGDINTPAFIPVGTKATVKSLTPEQVEDIGAQAVLSNTYHLYLEPGENLVEKAGGLSKFMNWPKPTFTDSGGFQVFSLGDAYGKGVSKVAIETNDGKAESVVDAEILKLAEVDEEGVTFKSYLDGSEHRFTPEKSIDIQSKIGADIIFAFDECTSPQASYEYQRSAIERTHRWAKRCINAKRNDTQLLFGVVQGGRFEDLRKESAKEILSLDFDGFGIGGSFNKEDIGKSVKWVNEILPEDKPRHLLGIGEPLDIIEGVLNGCDTFDCVSPTRMGRNGSLYTSSGKINILNSKFRSDFGRIDDSCDCYTCKNYTRSYVAHLFHAKEMLAGTLGSIHNLRFIIRLVDNMRRSIIEDNFKNFREDFINKYKI
jgi:queuine tRNA-ribosyltransferase